MDITYFLLAASTPKPTVRLSSSTCSDGFFVGNFLDFEKQDSYFTIGFLSSTLLIHTSVTPLCYGR
ncbi:hypothetical protein EYF80_055428 [Liparis tanakae]|uniref:Uncharacterized protein n=1 Tax=Liparis tanakae TaxID=230148 RepID=A0A4Z2F1R0_9TELE|nr:hypothetical protein EYF80_055428 [Liparis tanakae]